MVVQTCVLSTRWRHLWRSVPCLDVDHDEFKKPAHDSEHNSGTGRDGSSDSDSYSDSSDSDHDSSDAYDDDDNKKVWEDFEDFAVNVMLHRNIAQLDSFRLCIDRSTYDTHAAGWLRRAMKHCTPDPVSQRRGLSSGSWRLKRLHLCHVPLDNRFMKHVSSACHSLEDLELADCKCEIQSITSHSFKNLILKDCRWRKLSDITLPSLKTLVIDGGSNTYGCLLVIFCPAVAYLHLAVNVYQFSGRISINEVPSLAKASINLEGHNYRTSSSKLDGDQFELLCSISNATSLELSGVGTTVLGKGSTFHEFKNLRNLLLDDCDLKDDFRTLFPKCSKKGTPKLNSTSSSELCGLDFLCENLKVEIIHRYSNARHPVRLLLRVSVNLSKNNIKLTKVD